MTAFINQLHYVTIMSIEIGLNRTKTHNELYFNYDKTDNNNCLNKCILSVLEHFSPSRYGFTMLNNKNYSPVILSHVSDNLTISSIPIWNVDKTINLKIDPSDDKYNTSLITSDHLADINFPKSVYKWPLCYVQSSTGIDIDLLPSGDKYRVDRSGYAHVYNYIDVVSKNSALKIRTRFDPPSVGEYFTRAFGHALNVIDKYVTDDDRNLIKINKEHAWIIPVISYLTDGKSLVFTNTSVDDSCIVVSKNGAPLYNKTLINFSRIIIEIGSDIEKNNVKLKQF